MKLTHFNKDGRAKMVDINNKNETKRKAVAKGKIYMAKETLHIISNNGIKKGDVLGVAQIAGIMGTKKTWDIIPMCHNILLDGVDISFIIEENGIVVKAKVITTGKTGVEMEALTGVSIAMLTIYDMCKAIDKDMIMSDIKVVEKTGGKSDYLLNEKE